MSLKVLFITTNGEVHCVDSKDNVFFRVARDFPVGSEVEQSTLRTHKWTKNKFSNNYFLKDCFAEIM